MAKVAIGGPLFIVEGICLNGDAWQCLVGPTKWMLGISRVIVSNPVSLMPACLWTRHLFPDVEACSPRGASEGFGPTKWMLEILREIALDLVPLTPISRLDTQPRKQSISTMWHIRSSRSLQPYQSATLIIPVLMIDVSGGWLKMPHHLVHCCWLVLTTVNEVIKIVNAPHFQHSLSSSHHWIKSTTSKVTYSVLIGSQPHVIDPLERADPLSPLVGIE